MKKISAALTNFLDMMMPQFNAKKVIYCLMSTVAICLSPFDNSTTYYSPIRPCLMLLFLLFHFNYYYYYYFGTFVRVSKEISPYVNLFDTFLSSNGKRTWDQTCMLHSC